MITHLVFWKLQDENKPENARHIKRSLEALVGLIPGPLEMRVGVDLGGGEYDLALCSRFEDMAALHGGDHGRGQHVLHRGGSDGYAIAGTGVQNEKNRRH